jgi:hypothetical protein
MGNARATKAQSKLLFVIVLVGAVLLVLDGQTLKSYTRRERKEIYIDIEREREREMKEAIEDVPINTNSTIADDLVTIVHHPRASEIAVHFRSDSRCTHIHLAGRLSGPLLSKISWDALEPPTNCIHTANHTASNSNCTRVVTGRYRVPRGGRFFLEILLLMCNPVAQGTCLEDPERHRLTAKGAAISIDVEEDRVRTTTDTTTNAEKPATVGYWYSTLANASDHEPLYTRYQPPNCRKRHQAKTARCQAATDLSRFAPYRFAFGKAHQNLTRDSLRDRIQELRRNHIVCFVGASHAKVLTNTAGSLLKEVVAVKRIEVKYADEINNATIDALVEQNCTKVVVGLGQWDAGWPGGRLTSFVDWKRALSDASRLFAEQPPNTSHPMDVVFRRTHYNPIGFRTQCNPKARDWRNPVVIDRYNTILHTICDRHGLPFVDTGAIMSPVWDSAADWSHYRDQDSSQAEALYLLDRLFFQ